jgi:hypothetical protein
VRGSRRRVGDLVWCARDAASRAREGGLMADDGSARRRDEELAAAAAAGTACTAQQEKHREVAGRLRVHDGLRYVRLDQRHAAAQPLCHNAAERAQQEDVGGALWMHLEWRSRKTESTVSHASFCTLEPTSSVWRLHRRGMLCRTLRPRPQCRLRAAAAAAVLALIGGSGGGGCAVFLWV